MASGTPWEEKERTCLIDTANLWDATELVGLISDRIRTEAITQVPVVGVMTERATKLVKAFEDQGHTSLDEILGELDDIILQAKERTVLVEEKPKQPGRVATDPEVLRSLSKRLDGIQDKMRLRVATATINCIIGGE